MMRVVVLISGRGSNLQALIDAWQSGGFSIVGVVSNNANAAGLQFAAGAGITTAAVPHLDHVDREGFERALIKVIDRWQPDLIVLAGFMRILTGKFVGHYAGRMINIHPSLLPDFPGLNTHERALQAAVQWHGASVHYVTDELDGGPVISQTRMSIEVDDQAKDLAARLLPREHRLLAATVTEIARGSIGLKNGRVILNGEYLEKPLVFD